MKSQGDKPEVMLKAVIGKAYPHGATGRIGAWIMAYFEMNLTEINKEGILRAILFDHSFAKAYWGEDKCIDVSYFPINKKTTHDVISIWQYHLQQAVLSENPLLYYFERL